MYIATPFLEIFGPNLAGINFTKLKNHLPNFNFLCCLKEAQHWHELFLTDMTFLREWCFSACSTPKLNFIGPWLTYFNSSRFSWEKRRQEQKNRKKTSDFTLPQMLIVNHSRPLFRPSKDPVCHLRATVDYPRATVDQPRAPIGHSGPP